MDNIRNFCIIAHIDHGKSTLADRFLEVTQTVAKKDLQDQTLDSHPVSRERGITIRLAPVTMHYQLQTTNYQLNLIDTPGHVDFSYEVERALAACEGAILLVDATQGIQAQTLSHYHRAKNLGLTIIPVLNKIDLPSAKFDQLDQLDNFEKIYRISAKTGEGIQELLQAVIDKIPPPKSKNDSSRALVFSSQYDPARGVIAYVRVIDGRIQSRSKIRFMATAGEALAFDVGHFVPNMTPCPTLETGEVGYVLTNLKDPSLVKVGDTITTCHEPLTTSPLPGYRDPQPMVFTSFFPIDQNDYYLLEDGLKKLKLNDAAIAFTPTSSKSLGRGFRVGFLGHLHAEVSQERLQTDYNLNLIATPPAVEYHDDSEPWILAKIITPAGFIGPLMTLCQDRRGLLQNLEYHDQTTILTYELPMAETITDFFDQLKSLSSGFASLDYEMIGYRPFSPVKLEILINHEAIDALTITTEKSRGVENGKKLVEKLKTVIPRQQIPVVVQAAIDGQIIARGDIAAFRKDVTAKLYGGDRTRKDKLLEAQKKGKKKMKSIGKVEIPADTFLKIFST